MLSHGLIRHFDNVFQVADEWVWSGAHCRRAALYSLANHDRNAVPI